VNRAGRAVDLRVTPTDPALGDEPAGVYVRSASTMPATKPSQAARPAQVGAKLPTTRAARTEPPAA
jgi:hypothetical protein